MVSGCASARIVGGVYHSPKGYQVALPGAEWRIADESGADLELRHRTMPAGMLVNATCGGGSSPPVLDVLARRLLLGLVDRATVERGEVALNGRNAAHVVADGRLQSRSERMRIEAYVVRDDRCVYDFLYVAPPAAFEGGRAEFRRLVETFATE